MLDIRPRVAAALSARRAGRRPRVHAHQPRPAVAPEPGGRTASEAAVRDAGAVPATVAVQDGRLRVGLDGAVLVELATSPLHAARLPAPRSPGRWPPAAGRTTVSATMLAASAAGIRVFATGGIGGVHRGAWGLGTGPATLDISSDLEELARTPIVVVCAGPKAILDVPATLEILETRGVPVVAVGQAEVPGFFARSSGLAAPSSVPDVAAAAGVVATHLGLGSAAASWSAFRSRSPTPCPTTWRAAVDRAVADSVDAGASRARPDALAAGPHRRPDRRRLGPRQHRAHRQRREGGR